MYSNKELLEKIESKLVSLKFDNEPLGLYEPMKYVLSIGGKRIRPVVTLMAANLFSNNVEDAIDPAIGIEIFHNFTLLHDDIMDNAPVRRGVDTVHEKWDNNTAILSGDSMFILACQYIANSPSTVLKEVLDIFHQTALEVCEGQQYDMDFETNYDVEEADYIKMITLKTAVLLAASLKIGGLIGSASEEDANHLYDFGINLGLAFQLMDDLLDTFGDTATFGKEIGGDIRANKKTFLFIKALEIADESTASTLLDYYKEQPIDNTKKVADVTALFNKLGIKEIVEAKMQLFYNKSLNHLECINVPNEKKIELKSLAEKLMKRQS